MQQQPSILWCLGSKGKSKSNKQNRQTGGKSRGKGRPPKPRSKRGQGSRKRPLQLIDRESAQRSILSVTLSDNASETVSHRKPLSWRQKPRKRSAEARKRRELNFQQREQTARQLRTTRAKSSAKSKRTAEAPQCSRRSATAGSADPQPLTPLSPDSDSEHSSWGQQEETSEAEPHFSDDEVVVPEEADTTALLKQELTEEIAAFQAQKQPEKQQPSPTRTVDLPDYSSGEEPELPATPAIKASKKRPAEEPAGAASSSEQAQKQYTHEFDC